MCVRARARVITAQLRWQQRTVLQVKGISPAQTSGGHLRPNEGRTKPVTDTANTTTTAKTLQTLTGTVEALLTQLVECLSKFRGFSLRRCRLHIRRRCHRLGVGIE